MTQERGLGKCSQDHISSYGFPTRPELPFGFCSQCGQPMAWECGKCHASLPEDADELLSANYCRDCGASYFDTASDASPPALPD